MTPVPRRALPCVRCGQAPRSGERYTCDPCHRSGAMPREVLGAQSACAPITDPDWGTRVKLRLMAEHGWYGGWSRATRPNQTTNEAGVLPARS